MKDVNNVYKNMQKIMSQTADKDDNHDAAQIHTGYTFRTWWGDRFQFDEYPAYIRLMARTTPSLEELRKDIHAKFIASWDLLKLIKAEERQKGFDGEDSATNFYKEIRVHNPQAEQLTIILENDNITCFAGISVNDCHTDITNALKKYKVRPSKMTRCSYTENEDKNENKTDKFELDIANDIDMCISAYEMLLILVREIAQQTQEGRNFNSLSEEGAYTLCRSLFSAMSDGKGAIPIKRPLLISDMENDSENDCEIDPVVLFDDIHNIGKLFGFKEYETPYNILANIFTQIGTEIPKWHADRLAEIMAEIMRGKSFSTSNDIGNNHLLPEYTPSQIYDMLSETVVNQDAALKAASMFVYNHIHGHCRNMVMVGPTGCGKTEIWRKLASIYPCISILDGSRLTAEGWSGDYKLDTPFLSADSKYANGLILVIDEADKMMEPAIGAGKTDYSLLIQNELLKLMDHKKGNVAVFADRNKQVSVDCSKISIVLCGSFARMVKTKEQADKSMNIGFIRSKRSALAEMNPYNKYTTDDLIRYANVRDEVAGRVNQIVELNEMKAEDFMTIIDHTTASPVHQLENEMGLKIRLNELAKQKLAELAATSKLGCRVINARLTQSLDAMMFEQPDNTEYDLSDAVEKSIK